MRTLPLILLMAGVAWAAPAKEEAACQQQAARQAGTAVQKRIKCLVACDKQALKGKVPATNCLPPYGGSTRTCVDTVTAKALAAIDKKCAVDCPECWAGGDCPAFTTELLATADGFIDTVAPFVRCDDADSPDGLTKAEQKARQKVAATVGTYTLGTEKCLATCRAGEASGKVAAGACDGLDATDPKALACLIKVGEKAVKILDDPDLDVPECLDGIVSFALTYTAGVIDDVDPTIFCASPSGAFVGQNDIFE